MQMPARQWNLASNVAKIVFMMALEKAIDKKASMVLPNYCMIM